MAEDSKNVPPEGSYRDILSIGHYIKHAPGLSLVLREIPGKAGILEGCKILQEIFTGNSRHRIAFAQIPFLGL